MLFRLSLPLPSSACTAPLLRFCVFVQNSKFTVYGSGLSLSPPSSLSLFSVPVSLPLFSRALSRMVCLMVLALPRIVVLSCRMWCKCGVCYSRSGPIPKLNLSVLGIISSTVPDSDNKVFIGGLPYNLSEDQVRNPASPVY